MTEATTPATDPFVADTRIGETAKPEDVIGLVELESAVRAGARAVIGTAKRFGVPAEKTDATSGHTRAAAYLTVACYAMGLALVAEPGNAIAEALLDTWDALQTIVALEQSFGHAREY